jgi:RHH-type proline utilization regulon transcriptional repressor/proline dehydrogenase/delta 1-pyrroline-5-carboxylate dehydrogenase
VIDISIVGAAAARELAPAARLIAGITREARLEGALVEGDAAYIAAWAEQVAALPGKIVPMQDIAAIDRGMLVHEVSVSINTAATGGNASLMALSED